MPSHAAPSPSVFLPFNERQGAIAKDRAGHRALGVLRGGVVWVPGIQGSAISLDPKQRQFVELNHPAVNTAAGFTVSAWVKVNHLEGEQTFISQDGQAVSRFCLGKRGDDNRFVFSVFSTDTLSATAQTAASDFVPTPGLWYHLAGVYDKAAGQARLYADGTPLAAVAAGRACSANGSTVIGRGKRAGQPADFTDGAIDEVQIYPRSLTDIEVASLYRDSLRRVSPNRFTWANPIYFQGNEPRADIHDPDILEDQGVYYAVATLAPFANFTDRDPKKPNYGSAPGIALYASRDLKAWKFKTWILKSSDLPDNVPYKHQFWAPELHKFGRRYYVIFGGSNWIDDKYNIGGHMGYYQFVGVADQITGPYKHITALRGPGVDTSLFQDDDGKTYAVWPGNEIHAIDLSRIDQDQIIVGPMLSRAAGPSDFQALGKAVPNTIEGPYLIKHQGTYYCFFAETYPDLYATGIAMSRSLAGPWHLDPRWRVFPGGHQTLFTGPDGRFWMAYKHERTSTVPWLSIDPIDFELDGTVQVTLTTGPQSIALKH